MRELDRRNKQSLINGVQMLVHALEAKDAYTSGHSARVSRYAVKTAVQLGFTGEPLEQIRLGGELHDIGKIGTREDILNKPGPLTSDEFEHIKVHTHAGRADPGAVHAASHPSCFASSARITSGSTAPGSPTGCGGIDIPVEARIVAVVDAFDAMTTNRAYRHPARRRRRWTSSAAAPGTHFDESRGDGVSRPPFRNPPRCPSRSERRCPVL